MPSTVTVSIDTFPLGIGYMAAHASKVIRHPLEFQLFRYPDDCFDALDRELPDDQRQRIVAGDDGLAAVQRGQEILHHLGFGPGLGRGSRDP